MPSEAFNDIAELFETLHEESLQARTEALGSFRQLGPPDLVHVTKTIPNSRQQVKEVSSYHWVLGTDTSSSASIAAYINSLTYSMDQSGAGNNSSVLNSSALRMLPLRSNVWSISKSTYCCYNAFEGVDVRVEARIPGGVKSYSIDAINVRSQPSNEGWQEVFLSSILRLIFFNSADQPGLRKLNGLLNLQTEMRFLEAATRHFAKGWQLGTPSGPQLAASHNNFLTVGVVEYFVGTGRPEIAGGFLKSFAAQDPALYGPFATCLLAADQQGQAMRILSSELKALPNGPLLLAAADFLIDRGDWETAEHFAKEAIRAMPSDFAAWQRLLRVLVHNQDTDKVLIVLNNAPMCAWPEYELCMRHSLPKPAAINDPGHSARNAAKKTARSNGNSNTSGTQTAANKTASTSTSTSTATVTAASPSTTALAVLERLKAPQLRGSFAIAYELLVELCRKVGWERVLEARSQAFVMEQEYQREMGKADSAGGLSLAQDEKAVDCGEAVQTQTAPIDSQFLGRTGKRLCERWLDSLFLILFEDLRVFGLFKEELEQHFGTSAVLPYVRAAREWLLLGKLARRLAHPEEAKFALQKCIFAEAEESGAIHAHTEALTELLDVLTEEGRPGQALTIAARLLQKRFPFANSLSVPSGGFSHPSTVSFCVFTLIRRHGWLRLRHELDAIEGDPRVLMQLEDLMHFAREAKVHGFDY